MFFLIPILLPMFMLEFVPSYVEGFLVFGSGLMTAVSAALIVHWDDWRAGAGVAVAANLIMGLCYAYVETFEHYSPDSIQEVVASAALFSYLKVFMSVSLVLILALASTVSASSVHLTALAGRGTTWTVRGDRSPAASPVPAAYWFAA